MTSPENEHDSKNYSNGIDEQDYQNAVPEKNKVPEDTASLESLPKVDQISSCKVSSVATCTENVSHLLNHPVSLPVVDSPALNNFTDAHSEDFKSSSVCANENALDNSQTMLDAIAQEILTEAVTGANEIISQRTSAAGETSEITEDGNSEEEEEETKAIKENRNSIEPTHLTDTLHVLEAQETVLGGICTDSAIACSSRSAGGPKNKSVVPSEPASRDFPRLPLVDNLFAINIIDNILQEALNEIKIQNQSDERGHSWDEKTDNATPLSNTLALDVNIDEVSNLSDAPFSLVNEEECLESLFVPSQTRDTVAVSEEVPQSDSGNIPLVTQQVVPGAPSQQHENEAADDDAVYDDQDHNDWSKCNGYLADDDDFLNAQFGERELVTEIVYVSETSFLDEAELAAAAAAAMEGSEELDESPPVSLNPEAPAFIPMSSTDKNSTTPSNPLSRELARTDECTSRFSDFDDRVDISDYEDDGPKSTPSSISQTYVPTDDELGSSYQPIESDKDQKNNIALDKPVVKEETSLELGTDLNEDQIEEIEDEIKQIKSIAGTLFHQLQQDEDQHSSDGQSVHSEIPDEQAAYPENMNHDAIVPTLIANILNENPNSATPVETGDSALVSVNLDDVDVSNLYENEGTQMEEFEEYAGEKYMDHQQIYDPVKYKDYYQICSDFDVPDSPLDIHQERAVKNVTPSKSLSDSSASQASKAKVDLLRSTSDKPSTDEGIPEAVKGRVSEIVLHEADDVSECGSEDVETIGHRYESSEGQKHIYVNQLSLATELLRTKQHLPYDSEFKPLVPGTDAGETARVSSVASLQGTALAGPRSSRKIYENYYGNPCFEMETMEVPTRKEVSDSGVQSEESADEVDDGIKKVGVDKSPEKAEFAYKSFGAKRPKPMSAMLKGKSDPLCLCCEIM